MQNKSIFTPHSKAAECPCCRCCRCCSSYEKRPQMSRVRRNKGRPLSHAISLSILYSHPLQSEQERGGNEEPNFAGKALRVLRESNAFAISRSFGLLPGNRSLHPILSPRVSLLSAFLFPLCSLSNFLLPFSLAPYLPPPHLAPSAAVMSSSSSLLFVSEVSGLWSCSSNNNNKKNKQIEMSLARDKKMHEKKDYRALQDLIVYTA